VLQGVDAEFGEDGFVVEAAVLPDPCVVAADGRGLLVVHGFFDVAARLDLEGLHTGSCLGVGVAFVVIGAAEQEDTEPDPTGDGEPEGDDQ